MRAEPRRPSLFLASLVLLAVIAFVPALSTTLRRLLM